MEKTIDGERPTAGIGTGILPRSSVTGGEAAVTWKQEGHNGR